MIGQIERIPTVPRQSLLPLRQDRLVCREVEQVRTKTAFGRIPSRLDVIETEDHIEFPALAPAVLQCRIRRRGPAFSDCHDIAPGKASFVHLLNEPMHIRPFVIVTGVDILSDQLDHIHAKATDTAVEPPIHHGVDLFPQGWVMPVQVRLLPPEMPVAISPHCFDPVPGRPTKTSALVVWRRTVRARVAPIEILMFRAVAACAGALKPDVVRGTMIDDKVHYDTDAARLGFGDESVEVVQCAEFRSNRVVI